MAATVCDERHKNIDVKHGEYDKRLDDHEDRIVKLETHEARNETNINNLCKKIDQLVNVLITIFTTALFAGIGLIVKYILQL